MDCHFAQDRGTHYKRDEIKNFLDNKIIEMKKYDPKELKQLIEDGDLHNEIFNTDYYLTYTGECEEWLGDHVFDVIRTVKDYEDDNFGEVTTDISDPCKLVNMYVYIVGEELISEDKELRNW